jgi:glycosyltransferase involved in cell wall biosynthesis
LIVVDNASDPPLELPPLGLGGIRCHTVVEPAIGLTAARIRGIHEATGDLLVFVDDDNLLDPGYLAEAAALAETRPDLGAFGGRISPDFAVEPPAWLAPFRSYLALVDFDRDAWSRRTFPHAVLPCGAGMCIRRPLAEAWARAAAADPRRMAFGRTGDSLASAEDTDMALSCIDRGYATGRFTALHLTHIIPAGRLELDYQLRLARGLGLSYGRLLAMRGDLDRRSHLKIRARTMLSWLGLKYRGPARVIDLAYHRGFLEGARAGGTGSPQAG